MCANIKFRKTEPKQFLNYIDSDEIEYLVKLFEDKPKIKNSKILSHIVINETEYVNYLVDRLKEEFGNFKLRSATIWEATEPHNIHNNDSLQTPGHGYLGFVFPLYHEGGIVENAKLIFFHQYYYKGAAKFYADKNNKKREVFYNQLVTDYKDVMYKSKGVWSTTDKTFKDKYLSQIKDSWLDGLSLQTSFPWTIGSMMKFDVCQLHVASNFKKVGIKRKIAMSLFTDVL